MQQERHNFQHTHTFYKRQILFFVLFVFLCFEAFGAGGLVEQLQHVDTLFKNNILKTGIFISAGIGVVRSILQGNLPLAGGIIGVCIGAHYLLAWIQSDGFGK